MRKIYKLMSLLAFAILAMTACQNIDDVVDNTPTTNSDEIANSSTQIGSYYAFIGVDRNYNYKNYGSYYALLYSGENAEEPLQRVTYNDGRFNFYNLQPSTTYFYKVVFEVENPEYYKESRMLSFTTLPGISCGSVTYTNWDGETYPFYEFYDNKEFTCWFYAGNNYLSSNLWFDGVSWIISNPVDASGEYNNVYSCYPYSTKVNHNKEFYAYTAKAATEQYLYGNGTIDPESYKFDLNMYHATARVVFNISIDPSVSLNMAYLYNFSLNTNGVVPVSGYVSMENGKISNASYGSIEFGDDVTLKQGSTYTLTFYPLPATQDGMVDFYAYVEGGSMLNMPIDISGENMWKAGNTYTYNILYTPQELRIVSVNVQSWDEVHGGDVIINH